LGNIGHETSYYTYTDESEDFCNKAAQRFHTQGDRTSFKVLNLDKSPATQGFELNSFDIIIAAHCLQGRASLQIALKNARQLLKPGGYLLLTEITSDWLTRSGGMLCGFAGLWPGTRIDARLNASAWYTSLREAGFGGVDAMLPESTASRWPFTIMAAQAIDDRVSYLRRPLSASTPYAPSLESVAILGTRNLQSTRIAEEVAEYLGGFCDQVNIIEDLPTEEDARYLSPMTTFVNLVDIGSPIFENFSVKQMNGLKRMFNSAKHILWVTAGARVDQPYHSASISFCRSIRHEETHISLNNLNVSQKDLENYHWISREIVEHLLRQHALEEWGDSNDKPLLWSKEHEIDVVDGRLMIPRLVVDTPKDARLNSIKRSISKKTAAIGSHIAISPPGPANETFCLVDEPILSKRNETKGFVTVQSSSLMALNITDDTFLYLIQGTVSGSRKGVIALSCSNSSQVKPVVETILSDAAQNSTADLAILTAAVACELIAMSIVCRLRPGSNMLVHCTSQQFYLAEIVNKRAVAHQVKTTFVCDKSEHIVPSHESALTWVQLSSRSSKHSLSARLCPKQFTHWLDLAVLPIPSDVSELSSRIGQLLTSGCKHICTSDHAQLTSSLAVPVDEQGLLISRLEDAVSSATKMIATSSLTPGAVVPLEQIENIGGTSQFSTVALWPREGDLQVYLQPLNPRKLFSKEKTYLLVGLSGQIGQSIGEWMLSNGAGCVCLTSRNPRVSETWLQSFNGAIKIFSMDVTDLESVTTITKHIRSTCPPIAGVVNGAMVLRDALFSGMSLDEMQTSLGPKIQGSNNLDRVFYEEKLDFFILFSSLACVVGNPGQSNYATANGYLNGLARQRRRRGFAASVIDIGRVAGIGVVETSSKAVVDQLTKFGFLPISETDFHQTFAEAILAGYSDHERDQKEIPAAAVTTGIRTILDDDGMQPIQIPWFKNPFFSHCLSGVKSSSSSIEGGRQASSLVVSEQVSNATSKEEALEIILRTIPLFSPSYLMNVLTNVWLNRMFRCQTAHCPANPLRDAHRSGSASHRARD
jgi:hybrid polyketide synthase/nonribosomal peptide synthetase ACE1